jgi:DivIVA domain-containing protein
MPLSASHIRNRSFSKGLRGLDADEVHSFLDTVADRWAELVSRIDTLEAKLDEIGDTADKVQTAKERAEALQEEMRTREQRLDEREAALAERRDELDRKEAKLRSIAERLRTTLRDETRALSSLAGESSAADASAERDDSEEKSTDEWVDSLFPNRLPENDPAGTDSGAAPTDAASDEDLSASESQFEAIKQDVQGMQEEPGREPSAASSDDEEDEAPPTQEMDRIWDVFDEQE